MFENLKDVKDVKEIQAVLEKNPKIAELFKTIIELPPEQQEEALKMIQEKLEK